MTLGLRFGSAAIALLLLLAPSSAARASDWTWPHDWPQFRGRRAQGVADGQSLPVTWDVEKGTNVRWKTPVAGLGHASPIVTRGRVFVVTASSGEPDPELRVGLYGDIRPVQDESTHTWELYCLSQATGRILWRRVLHEGVPTIKRHTKASHANATPATDGYRVVVSLGSEGLYCYDLCGNQLWKKDLGRLDSGYYLVPAAQWGFASSPILYDGMAILQCDVQQDSFLAAFDLCDGRELWRTPRSDVPSWSTPTICESRHRVELVVNGHRHSGGYDPWTGKELWKLPGGGDIPVPTPIVHGELIVLSSSHGRQRPLRAIRAGVSGAIAGDAEPSASGPVAWNEPMAGIYMQTPIIYGDYLYTCKDNGILTCYEAESGERVYRERLGRPGSGFTASAVASDGKLYFTDENGGVWVVRAGRQFELLATNQMHEVCMATPAISGQMLLVRTKGHLVGIGEPQPSRQVCPPSSNTRRAFFGRRRLLRLR